MAHERLCIQLGILPKEQFHLVYLPSCHGCPSADARPLYSAHCPVVFQDQIHLLFRAEDGVGDWIGAYTSRIGHATSTDGITFAGQLTSVLYPADDEYKG